MRQTLWSVLIVSIVCAVSVGLVAQAPGSSAAQAGKQVTFSGCVEKAPSEVGSALANLAAGAASTNFILTNASPESPVAVGTAGTAKPSARYRLDVDEAKISPYVGHKVEVTGTLDEQPGSASSPGSAAASGASGPKFKVVSVMTVAAVCP